MKGHSRTTIFANLGHEPGYSGSAFSRDEAAGARFRNAARVVKAREDKGGDATPLGSRGTILGSIGFPAVGFGYFVEWDEPERFVSFCVESKLDPEQ